MTCLVAVWAKAEVLDGLAGVLWATEKDHVGASWGAKSELIEGDALTTGLLNASASGGGEAESGDAQLGDLEETVVIGDGADDGADLVTARLLVVLVGSHADDLGERDRRGVDARHAQSIHSQNLTTYLQIISRLFTHLLRTVALNLLSVRRSRKLYSLCNSLRYGLVLCGA